jgi:hypothetical protein
MRAYGPKEQLGLSEGAPGRRTWGGAAAAGRHRRPAARWAAAAAPGRAAAARARATPNAPAGPQPRPPRHIKDGRIKVRLHTVLELSAAGGEGKRRAAGAHANVVRSFLGT